MQHREQENGDGPVEVEVCPQAGVGEDVTWAAQVAVDDDDPVVLVRRAKLVGDGPEEG
ncbi:MAG: hypothetical protein ACRDQA_17390 [Nocardioidaceae bacterium]